MRRSRQIHAQPMLFSRPCPFRKNSQHLCPTNEASIMIYAALMLHTGYSLLLQVQSKERLSGITALNICTDPSGG